MDGHVPVEFDHVDFGYPSADKVSLASLEEVAHLDTRGGVEVLHGVSFRAEPGQMVALVGSSGAGKSTIAQLIPRLYDVDAGAVRLAAPEADDEQLWDALRRSRLDGVVSGLPDGLDTVVGERGYRLSGGERQRL